MTFVSKPYVPLAPKAPVNPVPLRKIIVDNPVKYKTIQLFKRSPKKQETKLQADKMRKLLVDTTSSGPVENLRKIIQQGEKALPILPGSSTQILPIFRCLSPAHLNYLS